MRFGKIKFENFVFTCCCTHLFVSLYHTLKNKIMIGIILWAIVIFILAVGYSDSWGFVLGMFAFIVVAGIAIAIWGTRKNIYLDKDGNIVDYKGRPLEHNERTTKKEDKQ